MIRRSHDTRGRAIGIGMTTAAAPRDAARRYRQSGSLSWFAGFIDVASDVRLVGSLRRLLTFRRMAAKRATPDDEDQERGE
jgi:hypothetical protein